MANYLILNQNQVFNGLGTLTYSVASTEAYNVQVQVTFPEADPVNNGAGSGIGFGSGAGGGANGFTGGGSGLGSGGKGLGFGASNNYPQPPSYGANFTANSSVTSGLSIVVNKNGTPIYTSSAPAVEQSALQFKTSFLASNGDSITVVLSSAVSSDNQLSGVTSNISIGQGL